MFSDLEENSNSKSNSDSFEKDFDDIKSDFDWDLKNISKLQVNGPTPGDKEYVFVINTVFRDKDSSNEYMRKVNRKYNEFEWLHKQLQKSFPGGLIPTLPTLYDLTSAKMGTITSDQDIQDTIKELKYCPNNYISMSNYLKIILSCDRFKEFAKLKEFITNPEKIKNIPNMNSDDPIYYSKVFKFLRSKSKFFLNIFWHFDIYSHG